MQVKDQYGYFFLIEPFALFDGNPLGGGDTSSTTA